MDWWPAYLAIGLAVGFLAGLLGIGGGMIMVPMLALLFRAIGFPAEHLMHLTLATAVTTIAFTSVSSVRAHHRFGAVDWTVARAMAPAIAVGAFCAGFGAGFVPTRPLAVLFTAFLYFAATQMLLQPTPRAARVLPGPAGLAAAGFGIGAVSSLLAAGGAFLSIPFLVRCNVPLKRAIGTAAANGFPIAVAGAAGYVLQGLRTPGLPEGTLGFVYLPALALIATASMLAAPWGARLAHRLPVARLRALFAFILYALATRMLIALW